MSGWIQIGPSPRKHSLIRYGVSHLVSNLSGSRWISFANRETSGLA